jgi:hypothetical protein
MTRYDRQAGAGCAPYARGPRFASLFAPCGWKYKARRAVSQSVIGWVAGIFTC